VWIQHYLDLAVSGVRSQEVAGKITRHLARFRDWFTDAFDHDRVSAITAREVAAWRDHLAAHGTTGKDGLSAPMAPATVNNHQAHLSALFTWIAAHAPKELLPHGDPTKRVEPLRLPAPEPRALGAQQIRTVKNVLDRLEGFHRLTGRRHDYLERERPADADEASAALFLAAASIATRRPGGRLSPRSINTIVGEVGRIHDLEVTGAERQLGTLRPHDLRHSFAFLLSEESGHNRAELERRLGHANDRYLRLYTNPPEDLAAGYVEGL
jgi:integrase